MSFFSRSKKESNKEGVVAVFDIGSASVGGALVRLSKNNKPKILYSVRKPMTFQDELDVKKFTISMLRALNSTVLDLETKGLVHLNFRKMNNKEINRAFCFISSPWNVSQTKVIKMNKPEAFTVSEELMKSMVEGEVSEFLNFEKGEYANILGTDNEVEIIDKKIVQIRLNGYRTNNPYKKKVKNVEAFLLMSLASKNVVDSIQKSIEKVLHTEEFYIQSFTLASFLSLRDMFRSEDDFVFLDVSGELTDISFIKDDVILETQSFPVGRNAFIREVMKDFKITHKGAVSLLNAYKEGKIDKTTSVKLKEIIDKIKKDWVKFLEDGMFILSRGSILPRTIFIMADDDVNWIFRDVIKKEKFTKLIFPGYNKTSNPILMNCGKVNDFCDFGSKTESDVFLGIESVFIDRLFNLKS